MGMSMRAHAVGFVLGTLLRAQQRHVSVRLRPLVAPPRARAGGAAAGVRLRSPPIDPAFPEFPA